MALSLYKHNQYGTLSYEQVDSNWSQIESDVNGLSYRLPLNNYAATTNPTVNDDVTEGYSNGSLWYNRTTDTAFVLTNASSGAANWVERDSISASDLGTAAFADILGTVSQSGGVPTGALIQYDDTATGKVWKYAGGLMICTRVVELGESLSLPIGPTNYDYPATFSGVGVVNFVSLKMRTGIAALAAGMSVGFGGAAGGGTSNSAWIGVSVDDPTGNYDSQDVLIMLSAFGRWHT